MLAGPGYVWGWVPMGHRVQGIAPGKCHLHHLSHTSQVYELAAPNVLVTGRRHCHSRTNTQSSNRALQSNSPTATTTRATESGARARSNTASRAGAPTVGCKSRCNGTVILNSTKPVPWTRQRSTPWSSTRPGPSYTLPPRTRLTGAPSTPGKFPRNGVGASPFNAHQSGHRQARSPQAPLPLT